VEEDDDINEFVRQWKHDNKYILETVGIRDVTISSSGDIVLHHLGYCVMSDGEFENSIEFISTLFTKWKENSATNNSTVVNISSCIVDGQRLWDRDRTNIKGFVLCLTC
jgi:hypothetical protein